MEPIAAIRIISDCRAAGRHLASGTVHTVPDALPQAAARTLVMLGRAVPVEAPAPERKRVRVRGAAVDGDA